MRASRFAIDDMNKRAGDEDVFARLDEVDELSSPEF